MAERLLAWLIMLPKGSMLSFCSGHCRGGQRARGTESEGDRERGGGACHNLT